LLLLGAQAGIAIEPTPAAAAGFNAYAGRVEARLSEQHRSQNGYVVAADRVRLQGGEQVIEPLTPATGLELPGALLHHWRGTAFVAGAKAADFERVMKNFGDYPRIFSPQVTKSRVLGHDGDHYQVMIRVRQKHILTVVLETAYDVKFERGDAGGAGKQRGYSMTRSMRMAEIDDPGTAKERALSAQEEHGYLWRQNTYWSYEERDGGLYIQLESISLSRSIPVGLGWAIGPFIESVPRESLAFTLRAARDALRK
jgi:hypothetical protein